jgi:hypothetical protein
MAVVDERLIDPEPEVVARTLHRATRAANGRLRTRRVEKDADFWGRFVTRTQRKGEGQQTWLGSRATYITAPLVKAAWWTDPVGRKHWRIVGRRSDYLDHQRHFAFARYPLWHVYPERLAVRQRGESAQLVARCDCGVVGPVGRIACRSRLTTCLC